MKINIGGVPAVLKGDTSLEKSLISLKDSEKSLIFLKAMI